MDAVQHLSIDIETYSDISLPKAGLYRYAQSPAFEVLLIAYSIDGGPVQVVDLANGEEVPFFLYSALFMPHVIKHAFNAAFEWYCLSKAFHLTEEQAMNWLPQWRCTMIHALYCGYPASLKAAGEALGLSSDYQKLATGNALIKYFCVPCPPTRSNGYRSRNLPQHDEAKWYLFKTYNAQDVTAEMEIERRLSAFPVPADVQNQWVTDLRINSRGAAVDTELVENAITIGNLAREELLSEATRISGLENPNSVAQLTKWLEEETGEEITNLRKNTVSDLLKKNLPSEKATRMLVIRQELSMTSNKKYETLASATCEDGRVRGMLQFYGANRTGRWAGRIVQPQNLPRTYIDADMLPLARDMVKKRQKDGLKVVFGSVPDALSQLIRTAFVSAPGHTLVDADFSAIEARMIAWLAREEWVLDVFRTHGKIYEAAASQMFGIPMEKIRKGNPEYSYRQRGKVATLALGYQGGTGSLVSMGALRMGIPEEDLPDIVHRWRTANPNIVQFWSTVEYAAREAANTGHKISLWDGRLEFFREADRYNDFLTIKLPSGRKLYYPHPHMGTNRFGKPSLCFWGVGKNKKWSEIETYGGKLAENITQAVARDCLAEALERLEAAGYPVVFHVHDEVVIDAGHQQDRLDDVIRIMSQVPAWAPGLPLNADGWINPFFKKD